MTNEDVSTSRTVRAHLMLLKATYEDDVEITRTFDTVVVSGRYASGSDVRLEFEHDGA